MSSAIVARFDYPEGAMSGIGERLREARDQLGLSQGPFGASIGVTVNTVSNWERGAAHPPADKLALIRKKYAIDLNWLMTGEGAMMTQAECGAATSTEPVKADILQQNLEAVEDGLARRRAVLDPSRKARLTVLLYKYSMETGKPITAETVDDYLGLVT